jgi:hypothetical protein
MNAIRTLLFAALAASAAPALAAPAPVASTRFMCDALNLSGGLDPKVARELEPAHSLEDAAGVLDRNKVPYTRTRGVMTVNNVSEAVFDRINRLPQGEPIVLPNGDGLTICVIRPSSDSY